MISKIVQLHERLLELAATTPWGAGLAQYKGVLRLPLAILCVLLCVHGLFAGTALTVKEISLMLRSGYSSKAILAELATRHFAQTLEPDSEKELTELRASPELIAALKSGEHAASDKEIILRQLVELQQEQEAKRIEKDSAAQLAVARQSRESQQAQQIAVAPAQRETHFKLPSEIEADKRAAKIAEMQERAAYCREHPVECETLKAVKSLQSEVQSIRH